MGSSLANEVYQLTMLYKVWRFQGRILMQLTLYKTLTATCLNFLNTFSFPFVKGWAIPKDGVS